MVYAGLMSKAPSLNAAQAIADVLDMLIALRLAPNAIPALWITKLVG